MNVDATGMASGENHSATIHVMNNGIDGTVPTIDVNLHVIQMIIPQVLATQSAGNVVLTWGADANAVGFRVFSSPVAYGGAWTLEGTVVTPTWTETAPSATKKFYYVVAVY
jgi:hypothetical protein